MQGRLLPKYKGKYQAHPVGNWNKEFLTAKILGFKCIEFIIDLDEIEKNPILNNEGLQEINYLISKTNIKIHSICMDFLMQLPLHKDNYGIKFLKKTIINSNKIGVKYLVLPCVDQSSLKNENDIRKLTSILIDLDPLLKKYNIILSIESDLNPKNFLKFIKKINSSNVSVNYDTGNSAYMGYDIIEEFETYGDLISEIHIKDRFFKGSSVILGTGDVNFITFFKLLKKINFKGPLILQPFRDEEGLEVLKKQYSWFINELKKYQ